MNDEDQGRNLNGEHDLRSDTKAQAMEKEVLRQLAYGAIERGYISVESLDTKDLFKKLKRIYAELEDNEFIIDHLDDILDEAKQYKNQSLEKSVLNYATYIEHKLNYLIHIFSIKASVSRVSEIGLMRELRLSSKATWALELLGAEPFEKSVVSKIERVAEARNAYVHYKWGPIDGSMRKALSKVIDDAESIVSDIFAYEDVHVYHGARAKLEEMFPV